MTDTWHQNIILIVIFGNIVDLFSLHAYVYDARYIIYGMFVQGMWWRALKRNKLPTFAGLFSRVMCFFHNPETNSTDSFGLSC